MTINIWKKYIVLLFVFIGLLGIPGIALAIPNPPPPPPPSSTACTGDIAELADLECLFGRFLGYLIPMAGLIFFFMFLLGGYKYITSGGDPKAVAAAHSTLTYAVFGLILAAVSYLLIYIISYLTGNTAILNFVIKVGP